MQLSLQCLRERSERSAPCGWESRAAGDTRTVLSGLQPLWVLPLALRAVCWQTVGTSRPPLLGVEVGTRPAWEDLGQRAGSQVPATPTAVLGKDLTMKRGQWLEPPADLASTGSLGRGEQGQAG